MTWAEALERTAVDFKGKVGYGIGDCCQFVARYWFHLTGVDHAASVSYADEESAKAIVKQFGGIVALIENFLGPAGTDPQRGDIVCVVVGDQMAAGVLAEGFVFCLDPDHGFVRTIPDAVIASWSCPHK